MCTYTISRQLCKQFHPFENMTRDILIINGLLLPEPGSTDTIEQGFVAIRNGLITDIGPMAGLAGHDADHLIDARGTLVMPGLVNTHCHAAMTLFRGLADDLELAEWLNDHIFPAEAAHVNPEMVYWCSKLAAAEMLLSGTTMVADGYFFEDEAARAFCEAGLRSVAAHGVIDFPAPGVPDPAKNIDAAARFLHSWQDWDELVVPAVFAHSPYTCSPETLQKAKRLATENEALFFIHVAESAAEQAMIIDPQGSSPVRHLEALGILDDRTVCVHCVWVDEEDIAILAQRKAGVSACPQSHTKLASGLAPLSAMRDSSVTVSLGTDGAASNNGLDLFREMDICAKLQKIHSMDPVAMKGGDVLRMATTDGADVLGMNGRSGLLRKGCLADLVCIDLKKPHLQPWYGPDILVYAAGGADVRDVIVNGKIVVRNRQLLTVDLEEISFQVRRMAENVYP